MHTTASDGELSPQQLIDYALKRGVEIIAITDHDEIKGIDEALEYAKHKNITVVPGIEVSCFQEYFFSEIDVIGLFIDHKSEAIQQLSVKFKEFRAEEKKEMIKKLNSLGYDITFEELLKKVNGSIGRPHIAKVLIEKYPNQFSSINDVFDKLIGKGKPAYAQRKKLSIKDAVGIIQTAGGIAILAHPGRYRKNEMLEIISIFSLAGGDGMEADYPYEQLMKTSNLINLELRALAGEKNLLISGGSDFHDMERGSEIGDAGVNKDEFKLLKQKALMPLRGKMHNGI